jgi:hypothetical protein
MVLNLFIASLWAGCNCHTPRARSSQPDLPVTYIVVAQGDQDEEGDKYPKSKKNAAHNASLDDKCLLTVQGEWLGYPSPCPD